jgi:2,3-bisphosphoglycerate-independent phosphoglycerate mutase
MGIAKEDESNGLFVSYTPVLDELMKSGNVTTLAAHGIAVGLPTDDDMGNSEVGHNALGAGRVFAQGAKLVNKALKSGTAFNGEAWNTIKKQAANGGTIHFIGLLSDGNVHSHIDQLFTLLTQCATNGFKKVRVHTLLDGRDVAAKSALDYIAPLEEKLSELSKDGRDYSIASGGGRMITTMDRYGADWSIVERGWKAHVLGEGRKFESAKAAIECYYDEDPDMTDQYMESFVITDNNDKPVGTIEDGDGVIFFNFRGDRAIEISQAFDDDDFTHFDRKRRPQVFYAGIMQYDGDALVPKSYLVSPPQIDETLSEYLAASGIRSFATSETQKFGHVTYFWNGNKAGYIDEKLELFLEIESDKVQFDKRPWMKADEINDAVMNAVKSKKYDFIRVNFPNGDMVGHTGNEAAVRIAVETVDLCLGKLIKSVKAAKGICLITADHGNADCMWTMKKGKKEPHVAHTLNPVPCIIVDYRDKAAWRMKDMDNGGLSNVAATLCNLLGFEAPEGYDTTLIEPVVPCNA